MGGVKNSSDLERAPGARSIADEFFDPPILVTEMWGIELEHFSQKWFTYWWHDPVGMHRQCGILLELPGLMLVLTGNSYS